MATTTKKTPRAKARKAAKSKPRKTSTAPKRKPARKAARARNGKGRRPGPSTTPYKPTTTTARKNAPKKARTKASKTGKGKLKPKAATHKPTRKAARARNGKGRRPSTKIGRRTSTRGAVVPGRKPRRKNSGQTAADMFEQFHGKPSTGSKEHRREIEYRDQLANLGTLKRLDVITPAGEALELDFTGPVKVTCDPSGQSIYFLGGNQSLPLDSIDLGNVDKRKDHLVIGQCTFIVYRTSKAFHDFEETDYGHEFGEDGGDAPFLNYDALNKLIYLTGGSYQVKPDGITD